MLTIYIHKKREKSNNIGCLFNQMNYNYYKYPIFLLLFIPIIGLIMIYSIAVDTNLNVFKQKYTHSILYF